MQSSSRLLLGLLGAGLLLGIAGLAWILTRSADGPLQGPEVSIAQSETRPKTNLTAPQLMPSSSKAVARATNMVVLVMSEDGRRLPEARIALTNPAGEVFNSEGSADLRNCASGEWQMVVRQKGVMNHSRSVHVTEGSTERVVVRMARVIRILGTASNVFGEPPGTVPVWFLAEGESHPTQRRGFIKISGTVINTLGDFQVDLPKSGRYRVSVGPIGEVIMATKEAVDLHPGGLSELTIVLSGGTDLDVILDPVPLRVADGGVRLNAALMVRTGDLNEGRHVGKRPGILSRPAVQSGRKHPRRRENRENGEQESTESEGATLIKPEDLRGADGVQGAKQPRTQENGPEPSSIRGQGSQWKEFRRATVSPEGLCDFGILPTDLDMRLAITRPRDRYESSETFRLQPNARTILRVQVPGPRAAHLVKAQPIGDLPVFVAVVPAADNDLKPGFTWK